MPVERLRLAVPGLVGIAGFLLIPTVAAWFKLMLAISRWETVGVLGPRPPAGLTALKALSLSTCVVFFCGMALQAASELRDIMVEAPVIGSSVTALAIGMAMWTLYAAGISALRSPRAGSPGRLYRKR